jgi:hypothetical protein
MDKPDWRFAVSLSEGFRSFKEGLDRKLLWDYWLAVKEHAWETFWGAGVIGIVITIITLYYPPSRTYLPWVVAWAVLVAGYYVWRADHVRLEKTIEVTQVRKHTWDLQGRIGVQYYFGIVNKSEAMTINRVRVQLVQMIPEIESISWLPILLHQQHDNPLPPLNTLAQSFDLNPSEPKNVDLLTGVYGARYFNVSHIVSSINAVVKLTGRHLLRVMITGSDIPISFVWFAVWMDEDGILRCELDPAHDTVSDASM